jgi:hypothetical protein
MRMKPSLPWFTSVSWYAVREPEITVVRRVEVVRRHANDDTRNFREPDGLADNVRIAVVEVAPNALGDHEGRRRPRAGRRVRRRRGRHDVVIVREPSLRHGQAEHLEEAFGDDGDLDVLRGAVLMQQGEVRRLKRGGPRY